MHGACAAHAPAMHASAAPPSTAPHVVPSGAVGFEHAPVDGLQRPATWHVSSAEHVTGFDPVHVPPRHASLCVHALPSSHRVPSAAAGFEQLPLVGSHEPARWHASLAVHTTGFVPTHPPALHWYVWLQRSVPAQAVPSGACPYTHPVWGLQVPAVWQGPGALQVTGVDPTHVPFWHASPWVHALPSLHGVPFAAMGVEHVPVLGLHVPATWQESLAAHVTGLVPVQTPDWQESLCVHAVPSLHAIPFAAMGVEHVPVVGLQVPATWQASLAAHVTGFAPAQTPLWHVYVCSHLFAPAPAVPFVAAAWLHVPSPLHESTVQGLPSSHDAAVQHSLPAFSTAVS